MQQINMKIVFIIDKYTHKKGKEEGSLILHQKSKGCAFYCPNSIILRPAFFLLGAILVWWDSSDIFCSKWIEWYEEGNRVYLTSSMYFLLIIESMISRTIHAILLHSFSYIARMMPNQFEIILNFGIDIFKFYCNIWVASLSFSARSCANILGLWFINQKEVSTHL